jgi:hypothetical protein
VNCLFEVCHLAFKCIAYFHPCIVPLAGCIVMV